MKIAESELYVFITDFLNHIFSIIISILSFIYAGVLRICMCVCIYIGSICEIQDRSIARVLKAKPKMMIYNLYLQCILKPNPVVLELFFLS